MCCYLLLGSSRLYRFNIANIRIPHGTAILLNISMHVDTEHTSIYSICMSAIYSLHIVCLP